MTLDEAARKYLGVPFLHQGRNPAVGIDCIGLIVCAGKDCGMAFPAFDSTAYGPDPAHGLLERHLQAAFGPPVPVADIGPGDVVSINFAGAVRHVGIVGKHPDGLSLIHTNSSEDCVTEARIDSRWLRRIAGVYR